MAAKNPMSIPEHWNLIQDTWKEIQKLRHSGKVIITGNNLDLASVVAVSRYGVLPQLEEDGQFKRRIENSISVLCNLLAEGRNIYGVNTGFGGSADTRTEQTLNLQSALLQHLHIGILTSHDRGQASGNEEDASSHAMPRSWIKGTILIRCNTVSRGHSAVSLQVIQQLNALLIHDIVPLVPLRGSVSASGDLSPLSYIAGALTGNPDILVQVGKGTNRKILPSNTALELAGLKPVTLGPKEGLGLVNGTATSAAAGSLALFDAHNMLLLSQFLTAMSVEALLGSIGSFDPFLAEVRPHPGQVEVAGNIRSLLAGSRLATGLYNVDESRNVGIYQDRYALRTSSQWLGPQLEDLLLAQRQIVTELNSTTDNPLLSNTRAHHGGNFQAASVTSAMEKTRLALQMVGKLLFAQCSEMINPMFSNGLPPNLAADEPSLSFTCKGIDTSMASYMSELAFLANPVSNHVQSAEMHNQAINSLALISARQTLQALEVVTAMAACHIFVVCQALDIRVMLTKFFNNLRPALGVVNGQFWDQKLSADQNVQLNHLLWQHITTMWEKHPQLDSQDRSKCIIESSLSVITTFLISKDNCAEASQDLCRDLVMWKENAQATILNVYKSVRSSFFTHQDTVESLGRGPKTIYTFVRHKLGVPFHQGLTEHPRPNDTTHFGRKKANIGSWISIIYESIRDGQMYQAITEIEGGDFPDVPGANTNCPERDEHPQEWSMLGEVCSKSSQKLEVVVI